MATQTVLEFLVYHSTENCWGATKKSAYFAMVINREAGEIIRLVTSVHLSVLGVDHK